MVESHGDDLFNSNATFMMESNFSRATGMSMDIHKAHVAIPSTDMQPVFHGQSLMDAAIRRMVIQAGKKSIATCEYGGNITRAQWIMTHATVEGGEFDGMSIEACSVIFDRPTSVGASKVFIDVLRSRERLIQLTLAGISADAVGSTGELLEKPFVWYEYYALVNGQPVIRSEMQFNGASLAPVMEIISDLCDIPAPRSVVSDDGMISMN